MCLECSASGYSTCPSKDRKLSIRLSHLRQLLLGLQRREGGFLSIRILRQRRVLPRAPLSGLTDIAMRIIFSRKGFESSFGGCPSPILDGRPISLPIPAKQPTVTTFADLRDPIPQMVTDLTRGRSSDLIAHSDQAADCHHIR